MKTDDLQEAFSHGWECSQEVTLMHPAKASAVLGTLTDTIGGLTISDVGNTWEGAF